MTVKTGKTANCGLEQASSLLSVRRDQLWTTIMLYTHLSVKTSHTRPDTGLSSTVDQDRFWYFSKERPNAELSIWKSRNSVVRPIFGPYIPPEPVRIKQPEVVSPPRRFLCSRKEQLRTWLPIFMLFIFRKHDHVSIPALSAILNVILVHSKIPNIELKIGTTSI